MAGVTIFYRTILAIIFLNLYASSGEGKAFYQNSELVSSRHQLEYGQSTNKQERPLLEVFNLSKSEPQLIKEYQLTDLNKIKSTREKRSAHIKHTWVKKNRPKKPKNEVKEKPSEKPKPKIEVKEAQLIEVEEKPKTVERSQSRSQNSHNYGGGIFGKLNFHFLGG